MSQQSMEMFVEVDPHCAIASRSSLHGQPSPCRLIRAAGLLYP
jgi:hypothetical protein